MRLYTHEPKAAWALIALAGAGLLAAVATQVTAIVDTFGEHGIAAAVVIAVTILLQLFAVDLGAGRGSTSFASAGLVVAALAVSVSTALVAGIAVAAVQLIRRRGFVHRAVFDAANHALPAAAAGAVYLALTSPDGATTLKLVAGGLAAATFVVLNNGGLCLAMSLSMGARFTELWKQRFEWATAYYAAFIPIAALAAQVYSATALAGTVALMAAPCLLVIALRRSARRVETAV